MPNRNPQLMRQRAKELAPKREQAEAVFKLGQDTPYWVKSKSRPNIPALAKDLGLVSQTVNTWYARFKNPKVPNVKITKLVEPPKPKALPLVTEEDFLANIEKFIAEYKKLKAELRAKDIQIAKWQQIAGRITQEIRNEISRGDKL